MSDTDFPRYDFEETVVLVTGSARGQGAAHALAFADHGADLALVDICETPPDAPYSLGTRDQLDATARSVEARGRTALPIAADVTDEAAVEAAVERTLDEFGKIDILVNNAGIWDVGDLMALSEAQWDAVLDTNLKGAWLCSKHVGSHLIERGDGGRIVSTGSTASLVGTPGSGHYAAAKHGLVGLTRALALELAPAGVTVNVVAPTGVETPLIDAIQSRHGTTPFDRIAAASGKMSLLGDEGLLAPERVSDAVLWLASDASRFVTGHVLPVDAGMSVK